MLRIGLTGGIGAGKSTVAAVLAERGAVIVDSDVIAREVVAPGTPGLAAVVERFGPGVLDSEGALDRPALAAIAFADDQSRAALNGIIHPLVGQRSQELVTAAGADAIVVQDIPLLVENQMTSLFQLVIVVWADVEERVHRLVTQRGMPEVDARARIAAQASDEQRRAAADLWFENTGSRDDLVAQVERAWVGRIAVFAKNLQNRRAHPQAISVDATVTQRTIGRLWLQLGASAAAVNEVEPRRITITAAAGTDAETISESIARAGFWPVETGLYASSDPGLAVTVELSA